ncbi:VOC family protein [Glycomyces arizonensis]|uniref:VOC family protein n=1 Tax=Glycomyces arizonensis TaxID=256035 RepID=UPI00047D06FF|nr:VOC family protein [Glycomyces arizonensis]
MDLKIVNVTVNTDRPRELAQWWAGALGGEIITDWSEFVVVGLGSGPGMGFQYVEGTEPGRIHLDLLAGDAGKEVDRLIEAGASRVADRGAPDGSFRWTVLADPDGNEFCVTNGGEAEH